MSSALITEYIEVYCSVLSWRLGNSTVGGLQGGPQGQLISHVRVD